MADLMNVGELADYLRIEKQTLYNWLHLKRISGIKVGRLWRFDKNEVDALLKSRKVGGRPLKKKSPP